MFRTAYLGAAAAWSPTAVGALWRELRWRRPLEPANAGADRNIGETSKLFVS